MARINKPLCSPTTTRLVGLHLSGSNSARTALVILNYCFQSSRLAILGLYEKIGPHGSLFSEQRIFEILTHYQDISRLVVDAPTTLPPCLACQRPVCPGVNACDDTEVAYLQSWSRSQPRKSAKKPINPQVHRICDFLVTSSMKSNASSAQPPLLAFSANTAPLAMRAQVLRRQLRYQIPHCQFAETSVDLFIQELAYLWQQDIKVWSTFRQFESGPQVRQHITCKIIEHHQIELTQEQFERIWDSLDVFQSFIASLCAFYLATNQVTMPPQGLSEQLGWVYLPTKACSSSSI